MTFTKFESYEIVGEQEPEFNQCIVVDLDTTLCNNEHRAHLIKDIDHLEDRVKNLIWEKFFLLCTEDKVFPEVRELILGMQSSTNIVILTARENRFASLSDDWLIKHNIPYCTLISKPDRDRRTSAQYKIDALKDIESRFGKILFCLEDQTEIVKAMRDAGYVAFDVRKSFND